MVLEYFSQFVKLDRILDIKLAVDYALPHSKVPLFFRRVSVYRGYHQVTLLVTAVAAIFLRELSATICNVDQTVLKLVFFFILPV